MPRNQSLARAEISMMLTQATRRMLGATGQDGALKGRRYKRRGQPGFRQEAADAKGAQARPLKLKRTRSKPSRRARHAAPLPGRSPRRACSVAEQRNPRNGQKG